MARTVLSMLRERGEALCTAESCTGGLLSARLVEIPGASAVFTHGFVTYTPAAKQSVLGVPQDILEGPGPVSAPCARAMAEGALAASGADYALSVTGYAGPEGGTPEDPVGTVYIGLARKGGSLVKQFRFLGDRDWVRTLACVHALNMLREHILDV
jgi:nicotinamide-nucleotide amidase